MKQPTSDGSSSITMCPPMVMMSRSPLYVELTSTTGPGSKNRRTLSTGKSFFLYFFMRVESASGQKFLWKLTCVFAMFGLTCTCDQYQLIPQTRHVDPVRPPYPRGVRQHFDNEN